jgi:RNA polymerase sigma-70 factor (ECF subfamily)
LMLRLVEPTDGFPERALLARVSAGDRDAFNELVYTYVEQLLDYGYYLTGDRASAEDIAQEVFCWLWDNRLTLHVQISLRAYLLTAVRHRALDLRRRTQRETRGQGLYAREAVIEATSGRALGPEDDVLAGELSLILREAIDSLPQRRREILRLRWEQLSYSEIARTLGISVKTVEAQVTRAFETLREFLGPVIR